MMKILVLDFTMIVISWVG